MTSGLNLKESLSSMTSLMLPIQSTILKSSAKYNNATTTGCGGNNYENFGELQIRKTKNYHQSNGRLAFSCFPFDICSNLYTIIKHAVANKTLFHSFTQ
jgi:hypothetical protein